MRLRGGVKTAKSPCFGPMSHLNKRTDHVLETGLSDEPGCIQMNNARVKDVIDCKPGSRVGERTISPNYGTRKTWSDFLTNPEASSGAARNDDQRKKSMGPLGVGD